MHLSVTVNGLDTDLHNVAGLVPVLDSLVQQVTHLGDTFEICFSASVLHGQVCFENIITLLLVDKEIHKYVLHQQ